MRVVAYIDGFSVYYACFRGPTKMSNASLKWLNYRRLIETLFPEDDVRLVRIYTAIAPNPPHDPQQASRHDAYLRALRALTNVEVYTGRFQKSKREAFLVHAIADVSIQQSVYIYQEKKSDVSLATHLMLDAFDDSFDRAVIMTNDTDFVVPVQTVRDRFLKDIVVISPDRATNKELLKAATSGGTLDHRLLAICQLENPTIDEMGRLIHKPANW